MTYFADLILLILCLGGAIRNGAGIVWAYNSVNLFNAYHPEVDVSKLVLVIQLFSILFQSL